MDLTTLYSILHHCNWLFQYCVSHFSPQCDYARRCPHLQLPCIHCGRRAQGWLCWRLEPCSHFNGAIKLAIDCLCLDNRDRALCHLRITNQTRVVIHIRSVVCSSRLAGLFQLSRSFYKGVCVFLFFRKKRYLTKLTEISQKIMLL